MSTEIDPNYNVLISTSTTAPAAKNTASGVPRLETISSSMNYLYSANFLPYNGKASINRRRGLRVNFGKAWGFFWFFFWKTHNLDCSRARSDDWEEQAMWPRSPPTFCCGNRIVRLLICSASARSSSAHRHYTAYSLRWKTLLLGVSTMFCERK